jgi:hypothetical protein
VSRPEAVALLARFAGWTMCEAYHDLADEYESEEGFEPCNAENIVDVAEGDLRDALAVLGLDSDMDANDPIPDPTTKGDV